MFFWGWVFQVPVGQIRDTGPKTVLHQSLSTYRLS